MKLLLSNGRIKYRYILILLSVIACFVAFIGSKKLDVLAIAADCSYDSSSYRCCKKPIACTVVDSLDAHCSGAVVPIGSLCPY